MQIWTGGSLFLSVFNGKCLFLDSMPTTDVQTDVEVMELMLIFMAIGILTIKKLWQLYLLTNAGVICGATGIL